MGLVLTSMQIPVDYSWDCTLCHKNEPVRHYVRGCKTLNDHASGFICSECSGICAYCKEQEASTMWKTGGIEIGWCDRHVPSWKTRICENCPHENFGAVPVGKTADGRLVWKCNVCK